MSRNIFATDARSLGDFERCGCTYHKIDENEYVMVWEMSKNGKPYGYEVWKFKGYKNPDGKVVWAKPSDEDFGSYGWYCGTKAQALAKAEDIYNNKNED